MPAPATITELVELGCKAGILEESTASAYCHRLTKSNNTLKTPQQMAKAMIRDGMLTVFQARQLLAGRWKGFVLGRKYRLLEKIGAGGMSTVYVCEHLLMRRRVAIKILPTAQADDPDNLDRFYREARAVASLSHPNIVRAHDIEQDDRVHFLVMEFIDGSSLQQIVKKHGPLTVPRACHYIAKAALGLQHAHQAGLVHRDIKPSNLLLDRNGTIKVCDLGLARFFHEEDDQLTQKKDNAVLGTADYLAPEQALDSHSVDIRADIYSLGATFYFLLTGQPLFPGGSVAQKLLAHQLQTPRPLPDFRSDIQPDLVAVLDKMLAKKPEDRYQQPMEVFQAMQTWTLIPIEPPPPHEMPRFFFQNTSNLLQKFDLDEDEDCHAKVDSEVAGGSATAIIKNGSSLVVKKPVLPLPVEDPHRGTMEQNVFNATSPALVALNKESFSETTPESTPDQEEQFDFHVDHQIWTKPATLPPRISLQTWLLLVAAGVIFLIILVVFLWMINR